MGFGGTNPPDPSMSTSTCPPVSPIVDLASGGGGARLRASLPTPTAGPAPRPPNHQDAMVPDVVTCADDNRCYTGTLDARCERAENGVARRGAATNLDDAASTRV